MTADNMAADSVTAGGTAAVNVTVGSMAADSAYNTVSGFLKKHGIFPADIDLDKLIADFADEMKKGLSKVDSKSSLMMIPTFIKMGADIPINKPVIVIDAGGTNFRTALVSFDSEKKCVISDFHNHPMPGSTGVISKEEFFETMYGYIEPLLPKSDSIGFCFSYPVSILPNRDGIVIGLSKEVRVDGLVGELILDNLLKVIGKRRADGGGRHGDGVGALGHKAVLLNDTVATLLGGKASYPDRVFDGYIGFILGTGTNTCYVEDCGNILKLAEYEMTNWQAEAYGVGNSMLINAESGNFAKAPLGDIDNHLDMMTKDRGQFLFEKSISGAYQGRLLLEVLKQGAKESLFSEDTCTRFLSLESLASRDIDTFLLSPFGSNAIANCCGTAPARDTDGAGVTPAADSDARKVFFILDAMFDRIAAFTATSITAIMRHTGHGRNPLKPVCVTADGTTFYKSRLIRPKLDHYIREFTNRKYGYYCDFVKAENGVLSGTAIAALQNL